MKLLLNSLRKSEGVTQTAITGFSNFSAAFFAALAIILISRSLGPTLFGEFSAALSLATILSKLNDAGITIATQKFAGQAKNKKQVKAINQFGYKSKFILMVLILVVLLPLSPVLTNFFSFSNPYIVPVSICLGVSIVYYEQLLATLLATHSFVQFASVNILQSVLKLVAAVAFHVKFPGALFPVLVSYLAAPAVPVLLKRFFEPKWLVTASAKELDKKAKKEFLLLAKHSALLVFIMGILDSVGVLFVKAFLDSYQAGLLGGISRIAMLFTLIGVSFSQVLNNRVSRYTHKKDLDTYLKKALILSGFNLVLFFLTIPLLPLIISTTIGSEYLVAVKPLVVLLASVFMYIISVPFAALFYSFDKNNYFSISGVLQLVTIFSANFALVPLWGVMGSALAQFSSRLVLFIFIVFFARRAYTERYNGN